MSLGDKLALPLRLLKSLALSRHVDSSAGRLPIRPAKAFHKVKITKGKGAKIVCNGVLRVSPYYSDEPACIVLGDNATLTINGDFVIGNGVQIILSAGAELTIGGRKDESSAGITERTRIMVKRKMTIGHDCIIAWGGFVTDCDWHQIEGQSPQRDVKIGDHVWLAPNVTILKGTVLEDGCIVGAGSVVSGSFEANSLVAGVPAKAVKSDVSWRRDMDPL